jgi:protoporphyrinogen oxidase
MTSNDTAPGNRPSVVVLGGGLSAMATAYSLAKAGWKDITLLERGPRLGGLAGSFEQDGHFYPLGYHHILHKDKTLLYFLDQIGAMDRVRWRKIRMLFHIDGMLLDLSNPIDFLRFPMSLTDKARFVRLMLSAFVRSDWSEWEDRTAEELVDKLASPGVRRAIFERLTRLKFELPCSEVSGAWLGARLSHREGSAPLGYIPNTNWTTVLCEDLARVLERQGVKSRVSTSVVRLHAEGGRVVQAELSDGSRIGADLFVSSVPTNAYHALMPEDRTPLLADIEYTALISAICVTRQKVSPDFYWLNMATLDKTACAIFLLSSLNPSIGAPGETCINFVTHLRRGDGVYKLSNDELMDLYRKDFHEVFGFRLETTWTKVNRVPSYSPVFVPGYHNPPVRSAAYDNVYFTGNYRTYPSVMSTGTALGSGLETAEVVLRAHGQTSDLRARVDAYRLASMPRA